MSAVTVIVCGTPESAPSWWTPDSELSPMEAAWIEAMSQEQERWRELEAGEDRATRLLDGPCDCCQELSVLALVEVAGDALCAGCVEALGVKYAELVERGRAPGDFIEGALP